MRRLLFLCSFRHRWRMAAYQQGAEDVARDARVFYLEEFLTELRVCHSMPQVWKLTGRVAEALDAARAEVGGRQ